MIVKNHTIELKDASAAEMARFRQIMLGIWRQQIEDDKNESEMLKYVESTQLKNKEGIQPNSHTYSIINQNNEFKKLKKESLLTEKFTNSSSHNYTPNNPINFVDPDVKEPITPLHAKINNLSRLWKYNPNAVAWTNIDILKWKTTGGKDYLFKRKAQFVKYYSAVIKHAAKINDIPVFLLAGVAFTEFGGKPDWLKKSVRAGREFDWSGPTIVDKNLTITNHPDKTSFGDMAIQLGRAGKELDYKSLNNNNNRDAIQESLLDPVIGIYISAMHLKRLKNVDFENIPPDKLTQEQIQIIATRYNRVLELSKKKIEQNISYGKSIYKHKKEINNALGN